ncbi:MAG TPA: CheB methylesterase domain-containing protein, partial [Candidatus Obscuribacterales bacterium]
QKKGSVNAIAFKNELFRLCVLAYHAKQDGAFKRIEIRNPAKKSAALADLVYEAECIAIGASTGGPVALREVLSDLPVNAPPIVVAQHMPVNMGPSILRGLSSSLSSPVRMADDGVALERGEIYLAPPSVITSVVRRLGRLVFRHEVEPPDATLTPMIDPLMQSIATTCKSKAVGVILTGMGKDGSEGLLAMKNQGAWTIIQDEKTSVVFGMPKQAVLVGAVCEVAPLPSIRERMLLASAKKQSVA